MNENKKYKEKHIDKKIQSRVKIAYFQKKILKRTIVDRFKLQ